MRIEPHPADQVPEHDLEGADEDEDQSEPRADARGDPRRPAKVVFPAPEHGPEDAASVQGKSRHQVERGEHQVQESQVVGDADERLGPAVALGEHGDADQPGPEHDARDRPGGGHEELSLGAGGFFRHLGHAPENEQRDAFHRQPEFPGDQGMPDLVEDDGDQQPEGRGHPHRPVDRGLEPPVGIGEESPGQRPGDEEAEDEPGQVDFDLEPEQLEKRYGFSEHLRPSFSARTAVRP